VTIEPGSTTHYLVAASGCIPAFLAMFYFDWLDRKRPEPWSLRYLVTFVGVCSVVPVLIIDGIIMNATGAGLDSSTYGGAAFNSFGLAAGVEEMCKITAVFMVVWYSRSFDERMDGLVYGARAGLGFALLENCLYVYKFATTDTLVITWIARALLAVPGHAMWSGMLGYCAARQKFDKSGPGILGGYLIAVAFHGIYDFAVFVQVPLHADIGDAAAFLLLTPIVLTVVGWIVVRRMARTALHLDDQAEMRNAQLQGQQPVMPMQYPVYPQYPPGQQPYYYYWPGPPPRPR
jgi:RsiW-degrading membrane proteinase PrsW (M82 family)